MLFSAMNSILSLTCVNCYHIQRGCESGVLKVCSCILARS